MTKKLLAVTFAALMLAGLLVAAGCGSKDETTSVGVSSSDLFDDMQVEEISLDEDPATGIIGTFKDNMNDQLYLKFNADGTFEGDAWNTVRKGTYTVGMDSQGYNEARLQFEDGSPREDWSIMISMGKVAAIGSPDGDQFDKK